MSRSPVKAGTVLGPYTVHDILGRGASATVWRATDRRGREVALKVRRRGVASMDRRFLREFESMRSLRIPGVVRVYEAGIGARVLWYSMDVVLGATFVEACQAENSVLASTRLAIRLGRQLMDILAGIHQAGFVHRDIKPSNVLVDGEGNVTVLDFGIVRFFGDGAGLTATGEVLGTVPFMAPEQIAGLPFGPGVDVFAAGTMLHEAAVGPRPRPSTTVGWIPRICLERLTPLASLYRDVPLAMSHLVERLTAVEPSDRPSAVEAAAALRHMERGRTVVEWPEPPYLEHGDWLSSTEGTIGAHRMPPVCYLEGPTGGVRLRGVGQFPRQEVMQGVLPNHLRCHANLVGGPLRDLVAAILRGEDQGWISGVLGDEGPVLRRMWPRLPISADVSGPPPRLDNVASAVASVVGRTAETRPLLMVIHDIERVDRLTARTLIEIGRLAGGRLGILVLRNTRWRSQISRSAIRGLADRAHATVVKVPPFTAEAAREIAAEVCPGAPPETVSGGTAQHAVESGWRALAAWRGQPFHTPPPSLWPLAVRNTSIPGDVLDAVSGKDWKHQDFIRHHPDGYRLAGATARAMVRVRLGNLVSAAESLADAWAGRDQGDRAEDVAALQLLSGRGEVARDACNKAAVLAIETGRLADARRWLSLVDSMPQGTLASRQNFAAAYARARVALYTTAGRAHIGVVDICDDLAGTNEETQLARVLRAEYLLRLGRYREALVGALRQASRSMEPSPRVATRALLVATECRVALGQLEMAEDQLERAARAAEDSKDQVRVANARAQLELRQHALESCRRRCQETLRAAATAGSVDGAAAAATLLGRVLRRLGRRREATHQARAGLEGHEASGELQGLAQATLAHATLFADRGDAARARPLLEDALRYLRATEGTRLLPSALRLSLSLATLNADPDEATAALESLDASGVEDEEAPAAIARWWRTRGDIDRAMGVPAPRSNGYGLALWRIQRARASLQAGDLDGVAEEATRALQVAARHGLREVSLYARLLTEVHRASDDAWAMLLHDASECMNVELYLGSIEFDARRAAARGDTTRADAQWRALRARAEELGYRPGVQEAEGWIDG